MNVLFISSEVAPFSKTGGLADVAGALPAVLAARGHHVKVVTPRYGVIQDDRMRVLPQQVRLTFPHGTESASLACVQLSKNLQILFLHHAAYFDRPGLYQEKGRDYEDNAERFAFLSMGALNAAQQLRFIPDIVHLNDWQGGLASLALKRAYQGTSLHAAKSVFTVHNLAYQGIFPKSVMASLGIPWDVFTPEGLEFYDNVSFLKCGLAYADAITTVSPTYAREIQTPAYGMGLDGFLRARADGVHGILNGIDTNEWDPESDPFLPAHFSAADLSGKDVCKRAVLESFGLPSRGIIRPLFGIVSRFVDQKGIDWLLEALEHLLWQEMSFVAVGTGEPRFEDGMRWLKQRFPGKVGVKIGFDNALAHRVEAGCDFFLMPSKFEPCGLNQMYSLRYGTLPIVRATGGLEDTVTDLDSPQPNGFKFSEPTSLALARTIERALALYPDTARLNALRQNAMKVDLSWHAAARSYEDLYRQLLRVPSHRAVST